MSLAAAPAGGLRAVTGGLEDLDAHYGADVWHASELGVRAARGRETASFTGISPPWFKESAKAWARQRLILDGAFTTVLAATSAFRRFSWFIASCQAPIERPDQLDRPLLAAYLVWLASQPVAEATKALSRGFLRSLLEENRRYRWVEAIPAGAVIYHDEVGAQRRSLPRFLPEFVMTQLESEANLDRLQPHYRHLVMVITETGLRAGDACSLRADALVTDTAGWPCLRFEAHKMRAEQIVPLSDKAVTALRDQQHLVALQCCLTGTPTTRAGLDPFGARYAGHVVLPAGDARARTSQGPSRGSGAALLHGITYVRAWREEPPVMWNLTFGRMLRHARPVDLH